MNNPLGMMFQMMRGGGNPQQIIGQMMNNNQLMQNKMAKNVLEMAQQGNLTDIEKIGRNMAKEKGIDFDKAFSDFKNQFPIK